jgi:hypothetical protein
MSFDSVSCRLHNFWSCVYLSLFKLTTGCPYGRVLQKSISHFIFWRIVQDTDTEGCHDSRSFSWFFTCQVFKHSYTEPRFKVSSERLISNFSWPARESNPQCRDYKSRALTKFFYVYLSMPPPKQNSTWKHTNHSNNCQLNFKRKS